MTNKSLCNQGRRPLVTKRIRSIFYFLLLSTCALNSTPRAAAADAPAWLRALANAPMPAHDEKTDAVEMYSERIVTVQSADKIRTLVREAYKILRPGGRDLGTVVVPFDSMEKITSLRA